MFEDVLSLIGLIKSTVNLPISVSCQPIDEDQMRLLRRVGVDRIGIPVDASTEELFNKIKGYAAGGPYVWTRHMEALKSAVKVFGRGRVITHLIVGLGESDADIIHLFQRLVDMGVYPALFAFTPVQGTRLERKAQPSISRYRLIQIAHHLIVHEKIRCDAVKFDETGRLVDFLIPQDKLRSIVKTGKPFMTSGCPNCNRPYYNERAGGPYYNYPRPLTSSEISLVEREIQYGCPPDD
jgi:biotin synthase